MTLPDIVYVFRGGISAELTYSIRTLANFPHRKLWISGGPPVGLKDFNFIPGQDDGTAKYGKAAKNLRRAVEHPQVSARFALFNDDFFVLEPLNRIPTLNRGPLEEVLEWHEARYPDTPAQNHPYTRGMRNTLELLQRLGFDRPLSYELHVPMVISKKRARELYALMDDLGRRGELPSRLHWRTLYGNINNIGGTTISDVKVYGRRDPLPAGPLASTDNRSFRRGRVGMQIRQAFPTPSAYEK